MLESAVGRSEWSAKRERSEREADHERRRGSGSVCLIAVLTNTGCVLYEYGGIGNVLRVTQVFNVLIDTVS